MASTFFFFGNAAFSINKIVLVSPQTLKQYLYVSSVIYIWIKHLSNCIPLRLLCCPDECYFICFSGMMKTNVFFWVIELIDKIALKLKSTSNRILPERVTAAHSVITVDPTILLAKLSCQSYVLFVFSSGGFLFLSKQIKVLCQLLVLRNY